MYSSAVVNVGIDDYKCGGVSKRGESSETDKLDRRERNIIDL